MRIWTRRKRAFYKWAYGGSTITGYEERLLQRWWKQSGRGKLQMLHSSADMRSEEEEHNERHGGYPPEQEKS